jgi:hypothetical protein
VSIKRDAIGGKGTQIKHVKTQGKRRLTLPKIYLRTVLYCSVYPCSPIAFGCDLLICDEKWLGGRRRRAMISSAITTILVVESSAGLLLSLPTKSLDRWQKVLVANWSDGRTLTKLLVPYVFLGFCLGFFFLQCLLMLLCSTFSK